jgi:hypothetical protein
MPYDPKKRDATWTMLEPGLYVDPMKRCHIFPDEICATLGIPYTQENHEFVADTFAQMAKDYGMDMTFIELMHEREPES